MLNTLPHCTTSIRSLSTLNTAFVAGGALRRITRLRSIPTRGLHAHSTVVRRSVLEGVAFASSSSDSPSLIRGRGNLHSLTACPKCLPLNARNVAFVREFHSSRPSRGIPIVAALFGLLKSSTALGVLNTTFRVALTFIPAFLIKSRMLRKWLYKISKHAPHMDHKRPEIMRRLHIVRMIIRALWLIPTTLLMATLLASLERAPLTGRWRFILLSPQEEEEIVDTLTATWRSAVDGVLAAALDTGVAPSAIPTNDWRHQWVESTLRRLENAVPLLQSDPASKIHQSLYNEEYPFPPPSAYPLTHRPRPAQIVHSWMCEKRQDRLEREQKEKDDAIRKKQEELHPESAFIRNRGTDRDSSIHLIGPPYSCLVVDNPDSQNAFSYGFGPGGAGGVVVYTGFLDEVLRNTPPYSPPSVAPPSNSIFSKLFGSLLAAPRRTTYYQPTEQQTSELAVLLAHELAHLLLAHHLETLSSTSIFIPSVVSIFTDVARTILFPITMFFGPFVNDALAQMGKNHSGEIGSLGEMCAGRKLEIEADLVSARLLAYAGFDPRDAIRFWESRLGDPSTSTSSSASSSLPKKACVGCAIRGNTEERDWATTTASWAMGREIHPLNEERVQKLREELMRWETEWNRLGRKV